MSVESRIRSLEEALAARRPPHVIKVQLVCVSSRAEVAALDALRAAEPPPPPRPPGRVRLELVPSITAAELLRQHGIELPEETESRAGSTGNA